MSLADDGTGEETTDRRTALGAERAGSHAVKGIIDLPFQIVITSELEGGEYAAYRALTDRADKTDVENIILDIGKETEDVIREHYRVLLKLVVEKNPQYIGIGKGDFTMRDVLMEMVKDAVDERVNAKERETLVSSIRNVMDSFGVTLEKAMDSLRIPQTQRQTYAALVK